MKYKRTNDTIEIDPENDPAGMKSNSLYKSNTSRLMEVMAQEAYRDAQGSAHMLTFARMNYLAVDDVLWWQKVKKNPETSRLELNIENMDRGIYKVNLSVKELENGNLEFDARFFEEVHTTKAEDYLRIVEEEFIRSIAGIERWRTLR